MDYTGWIKDDLKGYFRNNLKLFQDMGCKIEELYRQKDERINQAKENLKELENQGKALLITKATDALKRLVESKEILK